MSTRRRRGRRRKMENEEEAGSDESDTGGDNVEVDIVKLLAESDVVLPDSKPADEKPEPAEEPKREEPVASDSTADILGLEPPSLTRTVEVSETPVSEEPPAENPATADSPVGKSEPEEKKTVKEPEEFDDSSPRKNRIKVTAKTTGLGLRLDLPLFEKRVPAEKRRKNSSDLKKGQRYLVNEDQGLDYSGVLLVKPAGKNVMVTLQVYTDVAVSPEKIADDLVALIESLGGSAVVTAKCAGLA